MAKENGKYIREEIAATEPWQADEALVPSSALRHPAASFASFIGMAVVGLIAGTALAANSGILPNLGGPSGETAESVPAASASPSDDVADATPALTTAPDASGGLIVPPAAGGDDGDDDGDDHDGIADGDHHDHGDDDGDHEDHEAGDDD